MLGLESRKKNRNRKNERERERDYKKKFAHIYEKKRIETTKKIIIRKQARYNNEDDVPLFHLDIHKILQTSSVARVYLGTINGTLRVVKCILPRILAKPELDAMQNCSDVPGVIHALQMYEDVLFDGHRWAGVLVLPFYPEGDLMDNMISEENGRWFSRNMQSEELTSFLTQMLHTIHSLHHAGYVHNDIKPENIALDTTSSGKPKYILLDLGHARRFRDLQPRQTTELYQAPEVEAMYTDVTKPDVYALARTCLVLFYRTMDFPSYFGTQEFRQYLHKLRRGVPKGRH